MLQAVREALGANFCVRRGECSAHPALAQTQRRARLTFTGALLGTQAEELLLSALDIDKSQEGAPSTKVEEASTLLTLSEMLRGSVSACQVPRDRRQFALRGIKYSFESFAISQAALRTAGAHAKASKDALNARRAACAKALHLLGYHCAEFASGTHATGYFEQATIALSHSQEIFKELEDDEMTATTLQDLGLCYYYQHRYKEAMALYTSAMRVIIDKLGPCHVALACPAFNIANIMCAAGTYDRAIDFYRIAWSINVQALGQVKKLRALTLLPARQNS